MFIVTEYAALSDLLKKITEHYKRVGYNIEIMPGKPNHGL